MKSSLRNEQKTINIYIYLFALSMSDIKLVLFAVTCDKCDKKGKKNKRNQEKY